MFLCCFLGSNSSVQLAVTTLICFCVALLSAQSQTPAQSQKTGPPELSYTAQSLLAESYLIGEDFVPAQRAFHLFRLAVAAEPIEPAQSHRWAEELLLLTSKLEPSWDRSALQKNAVAVISGTDPSEGLRLLKEIDDSVNNAVSVPEDLRASAAIVVYHAYWTRNMSLDGLEAIRLNARSLAETNQYPFIAVLPMFRDLLSKDSASASAWFDEICSSFTRGPVKIQASTGEFVTL